MCGLAGLFDIKGLRAFDPALLQRMTDAIAHRGPDGSGHHLEPGLGLGFRRLAIIDLSGGAQPMQTADRMLTIVFNGEIYNFQELRAELEAKGARFRTHSDTEVLLHGWRQWGERLLPRLNGMFAFALWDVREQTLVLARDRFGKKPLHYAPLDDGALVFGSEIKSLLLAPGVSRATDPQAVADFFAYGYVPDPKTIYRAIRKLPPAHLLVARRGCPLELRPYWSLLDAVASPADATPEALIDRLGAAVRRRLVADVPLGALLSGGVDSSAIVALMSEAGGGARTFSIAFGERDFDESAYARLVAERYGASQDLRQLSADDFSLIPRLPEIYDEPFGDVSAIPTFAVCAQARASVTVALSGDGGDEALAGYRRYRFHWLEERARSCLPAALRRPAFGALAGAYPRAAWLPRPLRAATTFRELSLDPADAYARMVCALPDETRAALFSPDFHRALAGYDPGDIVRGHFNADAPLDPLQRAQYADVMTYLPGDILTKVDRASMANSLELRSPMLDPDFFAWSFSLPAQAKLSRKRGGKALLKQALEPRLPNSLLYRPKQGFTVPLARWFRGPLREEVLALADSSALATDGALDADTVRRMAKAHVSGLQDNSKALWLVWVFNAFLAHRTADPIRESAAPRPRQPMPALP
ncbi:MAG: asparagine synthase [Phenylobacterium sp.]|nr:asparagine synthase [Phenylobacterium sp.]